MMSRIFRHRPTRLSTSTAQIVRVPLSRFSSSIPDLSENKKLLANFSQWDTFFSLFTTKGMENVMALHDKSIVNVSKDPVSSISVFIDLKNPLLLKYKFDPAEFLTGSKEAFRQISMAIGSKELFNYSNGFVKSCPTNDLLKISVVPTIYNACITGAKSVADSVPQTTIKDCTVMDYELKRVTVKILEEDDIDAPTSVSDLESEVKAASSDASDAKTESNFKASARHNLRSTTEKLLATYPLGSVAAIVEVQFAAKESYVTVMPTGEDLNHERITYQQWTFCAELSGKTELDWMASSFKFVTENS